MMGVRWGLAIVVVCSALVAGAGAGAGDFPASSSAAAADDLLFGVVPQSGLASKEVERMRRGRIDSVRLGFPWSTVGRLRDAYDWGPIDHMVRQVASEGLTILPTLSGSPEWAARRDGFDCTGYGCIPYAPASIETRYAFARFAGAAVERYGPDGSFWENNPDLPYRPIGVWQIWNEQNSQSFYMPDADPLAYAEVVKLAAAEIHRVDEGAEVVLGGMFGPRSSARLDGAARYLRDLYRVPGFRQSFEGVAIHPYSPTVSGTLGQIRAALRVVRKRSDNADLWITEIGWASSGNRDERLVTDVKGQARLLRETFSHFVEAARRWRLRGAYWYAWRDTRRSEAVCAWCSGAGLLTRRGEAKPAYRMLRRVAVGR